MTHETQLVDLLLQLFDPREFRSLVSELPGGKELAADIFSIRESSTTFEPFSNAVQALKRRNLIDDSFFDRLVEERPRLAGDINQVRDFVIRAEREAEGKAGQSPVRLRLLHRV